MTSRTDSELEVGTMVAHYRIGGVLGRGGMGTVYEAHDTALERVVAVKLLRPEIADDAQIVKRFFREARAAAKVNHPNLTYIYFVGTADDRPFFAMEYVPGLSLEQKVERDGPLPLVEAVDVLVQAARGLAAAHDAGVIHRDVKPSNLMLLPDGSVKVTDFGLAKSLDADVDASHGAVRGTPTYMSPEQCRGEEVDARTDVYGLGLTAWYLFAGRPAYAERNLGKLINDQMNTPLPTLADPRPDLPAVVDTVLSKLCAKDVDDRPQDMPTVAELLERMRPRTVDLAPIFPRAAALVVDLVVFFILFGATMSLLGLVGLESLNASVYAMAVLLMVSQFGMEFAHGTTVGKWLFHLVVVAADGTAPGRITLLGRFLWRFPIVLNMVGPLVEPLGIAPIFYLSVGGMQLLALLAGIACYVVFRGKTLSDTLTRTRVVYSLPQARREVVDGGS